VIGKQFLGKCPITRTVKDAICAIHGFLEMAEVVVYAVVLY
jgi:hypothetical protein